MSRVPSYAADIYSDEAILDPYPHYATMRDLGPLVYLPRYEIYAIPRYAEVKKALLAHTDFLSGHGVAGFTWPEMFRVKNVLASDEPDHSRLRQVMGSPLSPPALKPLAEQIESAADALIVRLIDRGDFDGMADFASFLPVSIVSSLVGLPEQGRDRMLDWAAASFDLLGVDNDRARQSFEIVGGMIEYVMTRCNPDTVKPQGWAAQIWAAVQAGKLTPMEAGILHVDILAPALDTTIFATGHLLYRLASNPDQWAKLKADTSLIPAAIEEVVRLESPIRAFGRVVEAEQRVGGAVLPAGARVLMMYASANRDDRKWQAPDAFDVERPGLVGHMGFGHGHHVCVGMHLARLEMRSLLKAMVARVERIEVGPPVVLLNNVLRGFASLPARFIAN